MNDSPVKFSMVLNKTHRKKKKYKKAVVFLFSQNCDFFFQLLNAMMSQRGKLMLCQYTRLYKTNQPTHKLLIGTG